MLILQAIIKIFKTNFFFKIAKIKNFKIIFFLK